MGGGEWCFGGGPFDFFISLRETIKIVFVYVMFLF